MFQALRLNAADVEAHEEQLRQRVRALGEEQRKAYYARFRAEMRDPDTYAVLNYFFLTGLHHMYLGYYVRGAVNLMLLILGVVLFFTGAGLVGALLIGLVLIVELMALFRSQVVVAHHNNVVAEEILRSL